MIYSKLKVKSMGKKQKGLFSAEEIKKGRKILDFPGRTIAEEKSGEWDLQTGKNRFIKAPKASIDRFLDHSCEPNSWIKKIGKKFYLLAKKNIKNGEEIKFDYDTTDYDNEDFKVRCKCKSRSCRKIIRGFKYLDARQKKKLERYLIPYLKEISEKEGRK